jgi:hypothetical protein
LENDEKLVQPQKPVLSVEDLESGQLSVDGGWLKEVWNKWPGDETIEELLTVLDDGNKT